MGAASVVDAVVVGAGHHGLVAASVLADAGWDVLVLEARDRPGGAVSSVERDGWVMDEFSACHPLAAASPVIRGLHLDELGLRWARGTDTVLVHPADPQDREGALLHADPARTAAALAADHPDDGPVWLRLVEEFHQVREPLLDALLTRWPPVVPGVRLARAAGVARLPSFARFLLLPVVRMGEELFRGRQGRLLLAGNAMHADLPPDAPGSGVFGWLLSMLAQDVGYPSPEGGTGRLAELLAERARRSGARIELGRRVDGILVGGGRATGVRTDDGRQVRARRGVLADTTAPALYERLLPAASVPAGLRRELEHFEWDLPTLKLNYRLRGTPPWRAQRARDAGVVHVGADVAGIVDWQADLTNGRVPRRPFALVGQMSSIDPTRSPAGTQALWLYTHLPRGVTDPASVDLLLERTEKMLDEYAPGWRELVVDRWVQRPDELTAADANLWQGAIGGGTAQLHQQLVFRPVPGLGGPRTHLDGLYLASASAHPSGGVHGGAGYLAARLALGDQQWWGRPRRRLALAALHAVYAGERPSG
ncbi:MAG TPA: NAD(P)/FAD-dependent oxidoreductase [Segeticoccus sp.]|nr:NAD(P)/FAD-dependent oxidoreductase [Segeticoccus sp.]